MIGEGGALRRAIDRWVAAGLIDEATASRLREDVGHETRAGTRRLSQYLVAVTAGAVLLIAAGVFLDWAWPRMGDASRSFLLAAAGAAVVAIGMSLEERTYRWRPAAYLMQTSGLALMLTAFIYSERAWADASTGGLLAGILALAVPVVLTPRALRRNAVMPAVHLAFALAFLAVFLDRAVHLSSDEIIWVLDAALAVATLALGRMLARDEGMALYPWALNAFVMAIMAGFVLVTWTAVGPLELADRAVWPVDVWLALAAGLTVWGLERGPESMPREFLGSTLACLLVAWIGLGFFTALEALSGPAELPLLLVGGAGVAAFLYGNRAGLRPLMGAAALAFVAPLWYWGVERGGALGAVAALVATAGILFWVSGRIGSRERAK